MKIFQQQGFSMNEVEALQHFRNLFIANCSSWDQLIEKELTSDRYDLTAKMWNDVIAKLTLSVSQDHKMLLFYEKAGGYIQKKYKYPQHLSHSQVLEIFELAAGYINNRAFI